MILVIAVLAGLIAGVLFAGIRREPYQIAPLRSTWLVIAGFLPQLVAFYLPASREVLPDTTASLCLISSQIILFGFAWLNRRYLGITLLMIGLALNLVAITFNGGFMPIAPQTAARLVPQETLQAIPVGSRFGKGKDILLLPEQTRFEMLSDKFLLPDFLPYQVAFSLGDTLIAAGTFWFLFKGRNLSIIRGSTR
ncbi:MAG TPA: DUF5317 domain-containing protein [Anaerolineaceae bacterium]